MRLPILMYHNVDRMPPDVRHPRNYVLPEQFEAQLAVLRRWGYQTISLTDWTAYRAGGSLPPRPIVITFDDGYRSVQEVAWPILARYGFRATVFVVAGLLGGTNRWDADEIQVPLLDAAEVRALHALGMPIGSHTLSHRSLRGLTDAEVLTEFQDSRTKLERLTGAPVRAVCYPYGQQDARIRTLAGAAGYEAGVVWARRVNSTRTDPFRLARWWIDYRTSLTTLRGLLAGLRLLP
jgi:peptidoglycan/xylan/chitin deacetylase (PgdA/CDA1 family)